MDTELKRNVAWVRSQQPVIRADGVFAETITMNPKAVIENDTIYLFYVGDDKSGRRHIRLATASVKEPENFTYQGIVVETGQQQGCFDYAWTVLPVVIKIRDGLYYMIYSGNSGRGQGLSCFPGLGAAWSKDLIHWEKYEGNPVMPLEDIESGERVVGIAGGALLKEDLPDGGYLLHLYYTGGLSLGDNVFLDQQKACFHAVSTDGIHWKRLGCVRRRTTALDYENIASTAGPVLRDADGMYRCWYSSIGTRWGVYSITYAESEDGVKWNRGVRYGENLALGPESRDVDELHFRQNRWQDQSVSYPEVIREGEGLRMYYCGNEYGVGGIGTAVSAPLRVALTGQAGGGAKIWNHRKDTLQQVFLAESVRTAETGTLSGGIYQEGITYNTSVFFEQFPEKDGFAPLSVRAIAVNKLDGIHLEIFLHNRCEKDLHQVAVCLRGFDKALSVAFSDAVTEQNGEVTTVSFGDIPADATVCIHGLIR